MHYKIPRALLCATMLSATAGAHAGIESISSQVEHADYDSGRGDRDVFGINVTGRAGDTRWQAGVAHGQRDFGETAFSGTRVGASLHHDWSSRLSTRTSAAFSDDNPVFANQEFTQDVKLKLVRNTVFNLGGRYAEYYGGTYVTGWSAGAEYYLPRLTASYRHSRHRLSSGGSGYGNTLSLRLKDAQGRGHTQLWLGNGTSAYAPDMDPLLLRDSRSSSVFLRRSQPLGEHLMLNLGIGKTWHETRHDRFQSISSQLGLGYHW